MKKLILVLLIVSALLAVSMLTATVKATQGAATLFAYSSSTYSIASLLPQDQNAQGSWMVLDGEVVYIQLAGITECTGNVEVRLGTPAGAVVLGTFAVHTLTSGAGTGQPGVGDATQIISWMVGDMNNDGDVTDEGDVEFPYCTTMVAQYICSTSPQTYVASGNLQGGANHLHVVPEIPLIGTAGASIAMFSGFAIKMRRKRIKN